MDATASATDYDQRLLMLAEGDNVLIVTGLISAGETFFGGRIAGRSRAKTCPQASKSPPVSFPRAR